jgi:hypothetical protein
MISRLQYITKNNLRTLMKYPLHVYYIYILKRIENISIVKAHCTAPNPYYFLQNVLRQSLNYWYVFHPVGIVN